MRCTKHTHHKPHQHFIENAFLGPNCENVQIINKRQYKNFIDGMMDVVVVVYPNDVFVYLKEQSENIKKYIAPLSIRPMYGKRCWGTFHVFENTIYADGLYSLTKRITLNLGKI